jgi:hypothetical protein
MGSLTTTLDDRNREEHSQAMIAERTAAQAVLMESQHRIALSRAAMASSLFRVTRRRCIVGASDTNGTEPHHCYHRDPVHFQGHGPYDEVCAERDEFAAEFSDRLVSPVMRSKTGMWEWIFCAECPSSSHSENDPAT